jgi:hypothetical protein
MGKIKMSKRKTRKVKKVKVARKKTRKVPKIKVFPKPARGGTLPKKM